MAYQRRYFPALTITTTAYGDKSVTTDKLADKAVTSPKVAPDTIDSEHVVDESLKSKDIKDGEIKSSDIAPGAITTEKIAPQAVTVDKLEPSIQGIARPLTPGVSTEEIANEAVTKAKLAPNSVGYTEILPGSVGPTELQVDAVEESRIKDGACTRDKIPNGAIDSSKIATNAVGGPEILNRSVGNTEIALEGCHRENIKDLAINTDKINSNAVTEDKIRYDAVTSEKLSPTAFAARHKENYLTRVTEHSEDFGGEAISNKWIKAGAAGGVVYTDLDRGLGIWTGAANGNDQRIDWGTKRIGLLGTVRPKMSVYIPIRGASITYLTHNIGLWKDANNHVVFYAHDVGGAVPNWFAKCVKAGAPTSVDTTVAVAATIQLLTIDVVDATHVKFYIDGVEVAEINTNIPDGERTSPRLELITRTAASRNFYVKYFSLLATRADYV